MDRAGRQRNRRRRVGRLRPRRPPARQGRDAAQDAGARRRSEAPRHRIRAGRVVSTARPSTGRTWGRAERRKDMCAAGGRGRGPPPDSAALTRAPKSQAALRAHALPPRSRLSSPAKPERPRAEKQTPRPPTGKSPVAQRAAGAPAAVRATPPRAGRPDRPVQCCRRSAGASQPRRRMRALHVERLERLSPSSADRRAAAPLKVDLGR